MLDVAPRPPRGNDESIDHQRNTEQVALAMQESDVRFEEGLIRGIGIVKHVHSPTAVATEEHDLGHAGEVIGVGPTKGVGKSRNEIGGGGEGEGGNQRTDSVVSKKIGNVNEKTGPFRDRDLSFSREPEEEMQGAFIPPIQVGYILHQIGMKFKSVFWELRLKKIDHS